MDHDTCTHTTCSSNQQQQTHRLWCFLNNWTLHHNLFTKVLSIVYVKYFNTWYDVNQCQHIDRSNLSLKPPAPTPLPAWTTLYDKFSLLNWSWFNRIDSIQTYWFLREINERNLIVDWRNSKSRTCCNKKLMTLNKHLTVVKPVLVPVPKNTHSMERKGRGHLWGI